MSGKSISWILNFTNELPNDEERIKCLQSNDSGPMRLVLQFALDPNVEILLPEGDPPYTPNEEPNANKRLFQETRKLYLFVKGGNNNLTQLKRESMFLNILEFIDAEDAKLLLAAKDKKLPYKHITAKLVRKAYPGIF